MKKILQLTLGIITSVGGFLEIGSVVTAAQAGANYGYKLLWAILLGTMLLAQVTGASVMWALRLIADVCLVAYVGLWAYFRSLQKYIP